MKVTMRGNDMKAKKGYKASGAMKPGAKKRPSGTAVKGKKK